MAMEAGKSIVCFSANDWDDTPSSKFHIMRYLGKSHKILYVETMGIHTPQFCSKDAKRALSKLKKSFAGLRKVEDNIYVWSPLAIPFHGFALANWFNSHFVTSMVKRFMGKLGMIDPIIWSYLPNALNITQKLPFSKRIYHCIDDYGEFTHTPKMAFERMERKMLQWADITVVSAKKLYESRRPYARNITYIPHGVNVTEFQGYLEEKVNLKDLDNIKKPIAGLVGRLADWVDLPLIMRCARELPGWNFVLVGPSNVDLNPYLGIPTVHFLGKKDHKEIPHYIQRFDVCLMPYVNIPRLATANPLKMYEYLALGKPVVTIPMDEVADFAHVLTIVEPANFPNAIERAYEEDTDEKRKMRIESVSGRSWGDIAERILQLVDGNNSGRVREIGGPE